MLDSAYLKACAAQLGFAACGIAPAGPVSRERAEELRRWLAEGKQGEMEYLARNVEKKLNPQLLVEGARSVVSLAVNYYPGNLPTGQEAEKTHGESEKNAWHLARYAYGTDYHEVVKQMLRRLLDMLGLEEGKDGRCFVDTAPVDEKYWAERCGLGWRGKNSQLILPGAGSYFFLGELVLTHEADAYDQTARNRCGTCRACLDACPTQALQGNGLMDARRCLSYLSIEKKGEIPDETAQKMYPCFYGCDRCAEACPWNKRFARPTEVDALRPRPSLLAMTPEGWKELSLEQYQSLFRKSAVKRAKFEGLKRNIKAMLREEKSLERPLEQ